MTGEEREEGMTESRVMPRVPTSGQIMGVLVLKLGIKHSVLQSRTARRYFSADLEHLVKDSTRENIIKAFAEVLTDAGFMALPDANVDELNVKPGLARTLQWHADHWDLVRSFVRRRTMDVPADDLPNVWAAYVRLAVIDLAIRVAAYLHLSGSTPESLELLTYTSRADRGGFLNQKRQQAGLTLESLAQRAEVDDHTVDGWMYQGARPTSDNIFRLARVLADSIDEANAQSIGLELQALYWVSDVAELLAEYIGYESARNVIRRLRLFAKESYHIIDDQFPAEDRAADLTVLADLGVGARLAQPLLSTLIEREEDDEWREDLRSTGMDWVRRVVSVNLRLHLPEADDLVEKTDGRISEDRGAGNLEAYAHYRRFHELHLQGKLYEALAEARLAARLAPLDPAIHHALGSLKASMGTWRKDEVLVKEGLDALWIAVKLDPNWLLPWTVIGETLQRTGKAAEAVEHMRNVNPKCGALDSHYHSVLGAAYWKLEKLAEALAEFEASLELDGEETSALLAASELALLLGDHEKHRRYLRRARHFGADEGTLEIWEMLRELGKRT